MAVEKNFIVFSTLTTPDPANDSFPIMIDEDMAGGLRTVQHKADMLSIPEERRKVGMEVYVVGDQKKYRYTSETYGPTTTIDAWVEIKEGADNPTPTIETVNNSEISLPDIL
jgi:hypothetical protein